MPQPNTDSTFELGPEIYEQLVNWPRRLEREAPLFRGVFEGCNARSVLDLACGTGHHAAMFAEWGLDVLGVDGSEEMVAFARQTHGETERLRWRFGRMETVLPELGRFDAIVCLGNSFAMLSDLSTAQRTLAAIAGALNAGGVAIVHVLNFARLPDGPVVWQKGRRVTASGAEWFLTKGVHRAGGRAFIDVAPVPLEKPDDTSHCRSKEILLLKPADFSAPLEAAGCRVEAFGDHKRTPFAAGESVDLIVVATREG